VHGDARPTTFRGHRATPGSGKADAGFSCSSSPQKEEEAMRLIRIAGVTAVIVSATVGVAFAQFPGEPRPPAAFDAVADMQYTFARGAPNDLVREAQRVLTDLGYYAGPLDGILGPDVRRAVWNFQKAQTLVVSGSLDPRTMTALGVGTIEVASPPDSSYAAASPGSEQPSPMYDVQAP
jgi:hypothetical protein